MEFIAKTMHGLEELLMQELTAVGAKDVKTLRRAVSFTGDLEVMYKANLHCRTAIRILKKSYEFTAKDEKELYDQVRALPWEDHMSLDETFAIDASVNSEKFKHSKYASLKMKDAIVDRFRANTGRRPNVDPKDPDLMLNLFIYEDKIGINIDSSGESLHKRGYRSSGHMSPLNEVLAAGMIMLSNWQPDQALYDPMCGSGTIPLEAAMIASNIPPGWIRQEFGFMKWKDYDEVLWERIRGEAEKKIKKEGIRIKASDLSGIHVRMARTAATALGLEDCIEFSKEDFFETDANEGHVIMNPPYGERMEHHNIEDFYEELADHLKRYYAGTECWFISSNNEALLRFGLRPSRRIVLFNGSLQCLFQKFELYKGSKRTKFQKGDIDQAIEEMGTGLEKKAYRKESTDSDERSSFTERESSESKGKDRARERAARWKKEDRKPSRAPREREERSFDRSERSFRDRDGDRNNRENRSDKRPGRDFHKDGKPNDSKRSGGGGLKWSRE